MRKHLSKALALTLAMSSLASVSLAEGSVLNVWCWNDEFQSRFNAYYPEVKEVAEDKSTTTLNDGTIVKWTINPNADNNYQNKLDEALLAQESAADDDKIGIFKTHMYHRSPFGLTRSSSSGVRYLHAPGLSSPSSSAPSLILLRRSTLRPTASHIFLT